MTAFSFTTTRSLICEPGSSMRLPALADELGMQRTCIVTDGGILGSGLLTPIEAAFKDAGMPVSLFADVVADPP